MLLLEIHWWWIGAGYLGVLLLLYVLQERFIFKPEKLAQDFEFKYDVPFRELFFDVEPGVRINGLHFHRPSPLGLILYFHGNSRSIKGWAKYARDFYRYNYDVVLVDYRGFGKSTGKRSEEAMLRDMQYVYERLASQYPEDHIILYGRSMGSGFATKLASDNRPRYLILDAPYYNFSRVVERLVPIMPLRFVLRFRLRSDRWIRGVRCPVYIIHGTRDRLIPIVHSIRLQALNPSRTTLIRIHGGGHNNLPRYLGDIAQDLPLRPGDSVIIPQAAVNLNDYNTLALSTLSPDTIAINVVGDVKRPGTLEVSPNTPLIQALLAAGGFNDDASRGSVELVRLNPDGTVSQRRIEVDLAQGLDVDENPPLKPNDTILVARSGAGNFRAILRGLVSPVTGVFSIFRLLGL